MQVTYNNVCAVCGRSPSICESIRPREAARALRKRVYQNRGQMWKLGTRTYINFRVRSGEINHSESILKHAVIEWSETMCRVEKINLAHDNATKAAIRRPLEFCDAILPVRSKGSPHSCYRLSILTNNRL